MRVASSTSVASHPTASSVSIIPTATQHLPSPLPSHSINSSPTQSISTAMSSNPTSTANNLSNLPTSASYGNSVYPAFATFVTPTKHSGVNPVYSITANSNVTFKWTYSYLLVQPVSLTLNAVGPNSVTYPITVMEGAATSAVWNLGNASTPSAPLMNGFYKIQLYDQRGVSAGYVPGWLSPCTTLSVGLYTPDFYDPYTTISSFCPLCFYNAASSFRESFGPIMITFSISLLSSVLFLINVLR
ncbi:uncharacterized protein BX663DRAFT_444858 [Cokeromyces recurvatus]|uniref:uncharacterized protein n=1 Tax=Cokeromyces recurvatus TaxID=90255 RepID=UPI002220E6B8|nr:uncharacterized protein BX663DRAFT_444858 [Cokeromyces recurvatus]KAI7897573.1 hypothetical protein BX663DRAFT_444858 [Cokeromyces recurvatus]